jgi:hypothetical protein
MGVIEGRFEGERGCLPFQIDAGQGEKYFLDFAGRSPVQCFVESSLFDRPSGAVSRNLSFP